MNYNEIITEVATRNEVTKKDTKAIIDSFVEVITETLTKGEDVKVSGIGTFKIIDVAERTGTIMMGDRKGEKYVSPAHKDVKVKVTKALRDTVKNA